MFSRRRFALTAAAASFALPRFSFGATTPLLRIGLAADAQYADIEAKGTRFYRASIRKLAEAVEHFNSLSPDFSVHLGDLIDRDWNSFDQIKVPLKAARHQIYQLLGNHDFNVPDAKKPQVPAHMGMPSRYYSFDKNGFRFVALDTTEVSTYATQDGTPERAAAEAELKRLQEIKAVQAQPWNSGVSATQIQWLEQQCTDAAKQGLKVIIFAHHPIAPKDVHNLWNCDALLSVLAKQRHIVAWFNGHNHQGAFGQHEGVPLVTMRGMIETADTNAYAIAEIFTDRIILTGHGREPSRELLFRK